MYVGIINKLDFSSASPRVISETMSSDNFSSLSLFTKNFPMVYKRVNRAISYYYIILTSGPRLRITCYYLQGTHGIPGTRLIYFVNKELGKAPAFFPRAPFTQNTSGQKYWHMLLQSLMCSGGDKAGGSWKRFCAFYFYSSAFGARAVEK